MKKLFCVFLSAVLLMVALCPVTSSFAADSDLILKGDSVTATPGETVSLKITADKNPGIAFLSVTVAYDTSALTLQSAANGTIISDMNQGTNFVWSADENVTATGTLLTLHFSVSETAAPGTYTVTVTFRECYNEDLDDVNVSITNGIITVQAKDRPCAHSGGSATCTKKAICADCGAEYGTVDSTKHGETQLKNVVTPSCNTPGYTGDKHCKDCDALLERGRDLEATGAHNDADGKWESDDTNHFHTCACGTVFDKASHSGGSATCTKKAICADCGAEYGTVDNTKHGETQLKNVVTPSCNTPGYTGDKHCKDCDALLERGRDLEATGKHEYGDWVITKQPSEKECGEKEQICKVCGHKHTEKIDVLPPEAGDSLLTVFGIGALSVVVLLTTLFIVFKKKKVA